MEKVSLMQKLTAGTDLFDEMPPGVPVVEIAGEYQVLIEQHKGMVEFSRERICVKVGYGFVCVLGTALMLSHMSQHRLVISGQIDCVKIMRRS